MIEREGRAGHEWEYEGEEGTGEMYRRCKKCGVRDDSSSLTEECQGSSNS